MTGDHRAVLRAASQRGDVRGAARVWAGASLAPYAMEPPASVVRARATRRKLMVTMAGLGALGGGTAVVATVVHDPGPSTSSSGPSASVPGCVAFFEPRTGSSVLDAHALLLTNAAGNRAVTVFGPQQARVELERLFGAEVAAAVEPEKLEPSVRMRTGTDSGVADAFLTTANGLQGFVLAQCEVNLDAAGFRTDPAQVQSADERVVPDLPQPSPTVR